MYRLSILHIISWIVILSVYPLASMLVYGTGALGTASYLAFMLIPAIGATLLIRSRRFYAARLLLLFGMVPVFLVGGTTVYELGVQAASGYFGLTERAMDVGIVALSAVATVGAIRNTVLTCEQLPDRPGIAAVLRGRRTKQARLRP